MIAGQKKQKKFVDDLVRGIFTGGDGGCDVALLSGLSGITGRSIGLERCFLKKKGCNLSLVPKGQFFKVLPKGHAIAESAFTSVIVMTGSSRRALCTAAVSLATTGSSWLKHVTTVIDGVSIEDPGVIMHFTSKSGGVSGMVGVLRTPLQSFLRVVAAMRKNLKEK